MIDLMVRFCYPLEVNLIFMLIDKINEDYIVAFKAKNELKKSTLNMLKSSVKYIMIEKRGTDLTDADVVDVIAKEVKKRKDSVEQYIAASRKDLADKEQAELEILQAYMPKQMTEEEIGKLVLDVMAKIGVSTKADTGKVMKELMPQVKGRADGSLVKRVVESKLA